jgi:hypothetical protein
VRALYNYIITDKPGSFDNLWHDKYDVSWWTENAIFKHPYLLISYFYESAIDDWRQTARVPAETEILGDCGAYSATSRGIALDPLQIADWQATCCEIGFTLDDIPATLDVASQVGATKHRSVGFEQFKGYAQRSRENYTKAIEAKNSRHPSLKLYLIMHGDTNEKWDYWWDAIKDLPADGYGTGLKPTTNAVLQLACIARLHSEGIRRNVHLLGVSGTNVIPALAYASKFVEKITFDSMSYAQGSMSRGYFLFANFIRKIYGFGSAYDIFPKGAPIPCHCPVCQEVENPDIFREPGTLPGLLIALHNLYQYNQYVNECYHLAKRCTAPEMIAVLKDTRSEAAIAGINFWEDYMQYGIEKTLHKWREYLKPSLEEENVNQMDLFS